MAFKKTSRRMKRRYQRRGVTYRRRGPLMRRMRTVAYSVAEKKYHEYIANPETNADDFNALTNTGWFSLSCLNGIGVGTAQNQRVGRKIYVRYILLSFYFAQDGSPDNLTNGATCRYAVVHDRGCNGTTPGAASVFSNDVSQLAGTASFASMRNYDGMNRFRMLLDRQHAVTQFDSTAARATFSALRVIQHYVPVFRTIQYTGGATSNNGATSLLKDDIRAWVSPSTANCCIVRVACRTVFNDA